MCRAKHTKVLWENRSSVAADMLILPYELRTWVNGRDYKCSSCQAGTSEMRHRDSETQMDANFHKEAGGWFGIVGKY